MPSRSPNTTVQPPRATISWDTEAPTLRLPVVAPTPPPPAGKARRTVRRILVGLLLLFFGLVLLGALLPSTDATPSVMDAGAPAITNTVPSAAAPDTQRPPVVGAEPAPVAPRTVAPEPVSRQPVATQPVTTPRAPTPRIAVPPADPAPAVEPDRQSTSYANCAEVRAAGAAPIRRGDPGYSSKLDRDDDGVGCET